MDKSYADVTLPNKHKRVVNDWPGLTKQKKKKKTGEKSDQLNFQLNSVTDAMERLSTKEVAHTTEVATVQKPRDEIKVERQLRRRNKADEKKEKKLQEKITQIREPKSQKVQVVDKGVMDAYLKSRKLSPIRNRKQGKTKNNSAVKINLLDLMNNKVVKPIDRTFIQSQKTSKLKSGTQIHKGKKKEGSKKKYVSKLKKSILLSREIRNQMKMVTDEIGTLDCKDPQFSNMETTETTSNDKSITLPLEGSSYVKFSRKFRPYCDNLTTPELLSLTEALLRDIFRFQDRAYKKNEIKATSKKRYVVGFNESMRQLDLGKVKLLIIAPDLELTSEAGGISEMIEEMKTKCQNSEIPYVFSLKRRQLGHLLYKKVPVSCVGILNYQGSEETSQKLISLIQEEKLHFKWKIRREK